MTFFTKSGNSIAYKWTQILSLGNKLTVMERWAGKWHAWGRWDFSRKTKIPRRM